MADFKFACPGCGQHIVCDELWGGQQMQCPGCSCDLIVPQTQSAAAPVAPVLPASPSAAPAPQARISGTRLAPQPTPTSARPQAPAPTRFTPPPLRQSETEEGAKKARLVKVLTLIGVVIALGVGGYFGFGWVSNMQEKANEKRRAMERNSDGGEMGHIANLYDVLDATEPGGRGLGGGVQGSGPRPRQTTATRPIYVPGERGSREESLASENQALPVIPAVWTLDVATAKIPEGRVNGMISGTNFVADSARLEANYVLSLRQGTNASPDREILVYLHPKPGEKISGRTWTVSKEMKDKSLPQVVKRWKTNPKYAPQSKPFVNGYSMKLELGQIDDGVIPGKIFVSLPDAEQTVAAGIFKAETTLFEMPSGPDTNVSAAASSAPKPAPAPPAQSAAEKAAFEKRYGVKR